MSSTNTADFNADHQAAHAVDDVVTPPAANPSMIGIPMFVVGSIALGLQQVGLVSAAGGGAPLAIILMATGLGTLLASLWAMSAGQSAVAGIFGIFAGFWLSYAMLVLGLTHGWFAISPDAIVRTVALFLITWLVIILMLTIATLRLPLAFTVLFVLIDAALAVLLVATLNGSSSLSKVSGWLVFLFAAVGVYLYVGITVQATGGKGFPLGRPVISS